MAKTGRPSLYSEKLSESVLEGLAEGKSLVDVCKAAAMPSARTVLQWAADNTEFSQRYMRAREVQAEHMDNLIVETAKKAQDDPQAARVQIDAYKWRAAKLAPKKYGDAMLHKHADADGEKIALDEVSVATRAAAMIEKALERERTDGD
jgi:hypothetical protein